METGTTQRVLRILPSEHVSDRTNYLDSYKGDSKEKS
jgi:hypothetical protein